MTLTSPKKDILEEEKPEEKGKDALHIGKEPLISEEVDGKAEGITGSARSRTGKRKRMHRPWKIPY